MADKNQSKTRTTCYFTDEQMRHMALVAARHTVHSGGANSFSWRDALSQIIDNDIAASKKKKSRGKG